MVAFEPPFPIIVQMGQKQPEGAKIPNATPSRGGITFS